jgi:hypothetical protein
MRFTVETAFWRRSQGFGVTSHADTERIYNLRGKLERLGHLLAEILVFDRLAELPARLKFEISERCSPSSSWGPCLVLHGDRHQLELFGREFDQRRIGGLGFARSHDGLAVRTVIDRRRDILVAAAWRGSGRQRRIRDVLLQRCGAVEHLRDLARILLNQGCVGISRRGARISIEMLPASMIRRPRRTPRSGRRSRRFIHGRPRMPSPFFGSGLQVEIAAIHSASVYGTWPRALMECAG